MNLKRFSLLTALCFGAAVTGLAAQAAAAPGAAAMQHSDPPKPNNPACAAEPPKTMYINVQRAIGTTDEGKKQLDDLNNRFAPTKANLQKLGDAIQQEQKELDAGGNTLSDQRKAELARDIQTKTRDAQQQQDNANNDYQNAQTDVINAIGQKLMNVLEQYSEDHCVSAILDESLQWPQSPVLYVDPALDITDTAISLYNTRYPLAGSPGGGLTAPKSPATTAPKPGTTAPKPGGGGGGGGQ